MFYPPKAHTILKIFTAPAISLTTLLPAFQLRSVHASIQSYVSGASSELRPDVQTTGPGLALRVLGRQGGPYRGWREDAKAQEMVAEARKAGGARWWESAT